MKAYIDTWNLTWQVDRPSIDGVKEEAVKIVEQLDDVANLMGIEAKKDRFNFRTFTGPTSITI